MRILIVEDDPGISSFVDKGLRAEGYQAEVAASVAEARAVLGAPGAEIDLVLLDRGLPDADGATLLEEMRGRGDQTPVIILTARGEVADRVAGLNAGAKAIAASAIDLLTRPEELKKLRTEF